MKALRREYDVELPVIEAIRQADQHAMGELIQRQGRWVRAVIFGVMGRIEDVDDVLQQVWIRVWREAAKLDDPSRWRPWLYRIARNTATDALRRRHRRRRLIERITTSNREPSHAEDAGRGVLREERQRLMLESIAELPALYREPFVLRHMEDWSYREIGEALGLPVDTVETRLVRARRLLREKLEDKV
jgi:RNA polymerase sigma-70 factor (ECF subfamily)